MKHAMGEEGGGGMDERPLMDDKRFSKRQEERGKTKKGLKKV